MTDKSSTTVSMQGGEVKAAEQLSVNTTAGSKLLTMTMVGTSLSASTSGPGGSWVQLIDDNGDLAPIALVAASDNPKGSPSPSQFQVTTWNASQVQFTAPQFTSSVAKYNVSLHLSGSGWSNVVPGQKVGTSTTESGGGSDANNEIVIGNTA